MPGGHPFGPDQRASLAIQAALGCRASAYMLTHDCWYPEAIDALVAARPRPGVVLDLDDYRPRLEDD